MSVCTSLGRGGRSSGRIAVTLTVEGACPADAVQIGEWMVRSAIADSERDASNVRAEVGSAED